MVLWGCASKPAFEKAPDFTLNDLKGKKFSLSDLKGKVVLIDLWATWCGPCVMSTPEIQKLSDQYKTNAFEVLSLSLDQDEAPVRDFVKAFKMDNRVALVGNSGVDQLYQVRGIPAFYLIDPSGNVVGSWTGYHPSMISLWKGEIDRLLSKEVK